MLGIAVVLSRRLETTARNKATDLMIALSLLCHRVTCEGKISADSPCARVARTLLVTVTFMKRQRASGVLLSGLLIGALFGCGGKQADATTTQTGSPSGGPGSGASNPAPSGSPGRTTPFVPHAPKNHRASATTCMQADAGIGGGSPDGGSTDGGPTACTSDTDCPGTVCECGQDFACASWKNQNVCQQSGNCRIDADCGPGGYCSFSSDGAYCGYQHSSGYFCHTASDTCSDDSDCPPDETGPTSCQINNDNTTWSCRAAGP